MLRIYFLQLSFDLSDPAAEEAMPDIQSMRRFVGIELGRERVLGLLWLPCEAPQQVVCA